MTLQIIPYSAGAHPAMESTFNILEFAGSVPSMVYVEGLVGWIYIKRAQEIVRYQQVFERLCEMGLTPQESIGLIARIGVKLKTPES